MQPLVWGFEPLMDINGIQVVLHAFAWFVTYLFAGCILNGAPGGTRIRNPLHGKEMRWPITLLTHYGASYLCCPGLFNIGSVVDGCCPNDACQDTILRRSVTELSRNVWMREEESNLRPTAYNAKRIAVCAFKVLVRRVLNHGCPRKSWTSVSCVSDSYSTVELLDN